MIIRYPTGQYQDAGQLPKSPSDPANVTFTISNEPPKRPNDLVLQLPVSEEDHKRSPLVYSDPVRRANYGELVFTVVQSNRTFVGSNRKLFDIGEYLDFSDEPTIPVDQPSIPLIVDLQHNTNQLDLADSGLSDTEIASVTAQSTEKKKELENSLAGIQAQILSEQAEIGENQKSINEVRKVIAAVQQILLPTDPIVLKLTARELELVVQRDALSTDINNLNVQAAQVYNALINVSSLVK